MSFKHVTASVFILFFVTVSAQQDYLKTCSISIYHYNELKATVIAEIASTQKEHTYGLMYRTELPENNGMLFVYNNDQILNFWMKNVSIPLSIAYIDKNGIIRDIHQMEPNNATITYRSIVPVRYALEVNQGFFEKHNIEIGDTVELDGCIGK
ncbi:MAG: DUF192 domain-containing protein [Spirochaetota bacterium]